VVGTLVLHMNAENSFWVLVAMLRRSGPYRLQSIFLPGQPQVIVSLYCLDRLIEMFLPALFSHFKVSFNLKGFSFVEIKTFFFFFQGSQSDTDSVCSCVVHNCFWVHVSGGLYRPSLDCVFCVRKSVFVSCCSGYSQADGADAVKAGF
jgi:hypothetical protein